MENHPDSPWDKKFKSAEILENYKKYTNGDEKFMNVRRFRSRKISMPIIKEVKFDEYYYFFTRLVDKNHTASPWKHYIANQLTKILKDANKLFIKDGHGKTTSKEAFEYLQSIIESKEIKSQVKFNQGDEVTLGEWAKYRDSSNNNDQIELTAQEATELGISNTIIQQPSPSQPETQPQPTSPSDYQQIKDALTKWTDTFKAKTAEQVEKELNDLINNSGGKLPVGLPTDWRDKLARLPYLEKTNQDLDKEKKRVERESGIRIDTLNKDLQDKIESIDDLEIKLSGLRAENTHLKDYELKNVRDELGKWKNTFTGKKPYEIEIELNKPKLTKDQEEAVNNYGKNKVKLEEWEKAFPGTEFPTAEKARLEYDKLLSNQKPANHNQVLDDLNEWKAAFPKHKFDKKPEDIRKEYNKLESNQTPIDYQQIKDDLGEWNKAFDDPEYRGKKPVQVKEVVDQDKDKLRLRESELLNEYRDNVSRLVDQTIGRLKHVKKGSLNNKYGKTVDKVAEDGLTLENKVACIQNLNAVMSICATEKAVEWSKQIEAMSTSDGGRATQITEIVEFLPKVETLWKKVPKLVDKNNPFYLSSIENQSTYKDQIKDLITKWSIQKSRLLEEDTYHTYIEQPNK